MKNNTPLPIGSRVRYTFDWLELGTTIAEPDKETVKVKWDNANLGTDFALIYDLRLVDARADLQEATELQVKIDATTSLFIQAFKALEEVKNNNDQGAFERAGLIEMKNLYKVVDNTGWMCRYENCAYPVNCDCKCHPEEEKIKDIKDWFGFVDKPNQLEQEFVSLALKDQIRGKTEQAIKLLEEATELANKECYAFADELYSPINTLNDAVKNYFGSPPSGWETSGCFY